MKRCLTVAAVTLLSLAAIPSAALVQSSAGGVNYDANCKPLSEDEMALLRENLLLNAVAPVWNAPCRAKAFVENLVKKKDFDPDSIDAGDVFNAARPNTSARANPYGIPEGISDAEFKKRLEAAQYRARNPNWRADQELTRRRQTNAANDDTRSFEEMLSDDRKLRGDPIVLPPATPGGAPVVFQPEAPGGSAPTSLADINGKGVLLSADGLKKGTFNGGKLNGYGEEIDPDGTWRGGTFQNGTNMGYVYEVRTIDGKTYVAAGEVLNGKLDGMIERVYADGSTQFEDWENGQLMQVGTRAPKGQSALAPQVRYKPPVEVATEDAYKKIGPRPKIAPGTTFDPAQTIAKSRTANELSFEQAFADYKSSCARIVELKLPGSVMLGDYQRLGKEGFAEQMYRSANVSEDFVIPLFKTRDIQPYIEFLEKNSFKYPGSMNDQTDDNLTYSSYALSACAINVRLRQLGMPPWPYWG